MDLEAVDLRGLGLKGGITLHFEYRQSGLPPQACPPLECPRFQLCSPCDNEASPSHRRDCQHVFVEADAAVMVQADKVPVERDRVDGLTIGEAHLLIGGIAWGIRAGSRMLKEPWHEALWEGC